MISFSSPVQRYREPTAGSRASRLVPPRALARNILFALNRRKSHSQHIFIVGAPKSGTTLLQSILAAHEDITSPSTETHFFLRRRFDCFRSPGVPREFTMSIYSSSWSKSEMFDKFADYLKARDNKHHFVEKTPDHALVIEDLLKIYPKSKFLFLCRDGRDAYISTLNHPEVRHKFGTRYPELWKDVAVLFAKVQSHPRVFPVQYEKFCSDATGQLQAILEFLRMRFYPQLLDPGLYGKSHYASAAPFARLKEGVSAGSVGRWRDPKYSEHVSYFNSIAGCELKLLGYC